MESLDRSEIEVPRSDIFNAILTKYQFDGTSYSRNRKIYLPAAKIKQYKFTCMKHRLLFQSYYFKLK